MDTEGKLPQQLAKPWRVMGSQKPSQAFDFIGSAHTFLVACSPICSPVLASLPPPPGPSVTDMIHRDRCSFGATNARTRAPNVPHHGFTSFISSRCSRSSSLAHWRRLRTSARASASTPPGSPLRAARAFPSGVFGPVDWLHGFHARISAACLARCSDVQVRAAMLVYR